MRIQEISANDTVTQEFVRQMISRSTVLEYAEFYSIVGNADYARKAPTASGGQFRALDNDYPSNRITPQFANPTLKILGDKVEVDRAHERRGQDIPSVRARELLNFARDLGKQFQNFFFNGDSASDPNAFDGLKLQIPATQVITADTNGLSVQMGNSDTAVQSQQKFLELMDQLIETVDGGAQVLFMDSKTLARLTTIARGQVQWRVNEFGRPVAFYNDVPIRPAGYDKDGNRVIGHNEVVGTANNCTSVYAIRFGEKADVTLVTNIGVEVKDLGLVGVHYTHSVEFDTDLVILNDKALARLEGIIIA